MVFSAGLPEVCKRHLQQATHRNDPLSRGSPRHSNISEHHKLVDNARDLI